MFEPQMGQGLIRAARVVDIGSGAIMEPADIWIEEGIVVALRGMSQAPRTRPNRRHAYVVEAEGRYLTPALVDAHVHLGGAQTGAHEEAMQAYRAAGVSLLRDLSLAPPLLLGNYGVRVLTSDQDPQSGHDGWVKAYGLPPHQLQLVLSEARVAGRPVAAHLAPNSAKSLLDDEALLPTSIEHVFGLLDYDFVDDAHRSAAGVDPADAGIATWALAARNLSPRLAQVIRRLGDARQFIVPTLGVMYGMLTQSRLLEASGTDAAAATLARWSERAAELGWGSPISAPRRRLRYHAVVGLGEICLRLARTGSRLVLGTDYGEPFILPGGGVHQEMRLLASAGLSVSELLRAAITHPRELLGEPTSIAPGARADFVLYDDNPLTRLDVLAAPDPVFLGA